MNYSCVKYQREVWKMKIKNILALVLTAAMMFALLSGCTKTETEKEGNSSRSNEAEQSTGNRRTDIVIAKVADVVSPDPHNQNDTLSAAVIRMMYDTLVVRDVETGEIKPSLAESWEILDDTTYKFKIREGVKFHDGSELTLEDVKWSLDRARNSAKVKQFVEAISEVEISEEDHSVIVKTAYPYAPMLGNLSGVQPSILSKAHCEKLEAEGKEYQDAPMGTGPMKYKSWTPNNDFVVERFDDYWGEKAVATTVTFKVILEEAARTIALQAGDVDMLDLVPSIDVDRILEDDKFTTIVQPSPSVTYVSWNMTKEPYNNVKVRQALSYATNKQDIIDVVAEGKGVAINTIYSPLVDGYDADLNLYPYDVEKAKQLMTEAGYPDGFEGILDISSDASSRIAQSLQAQWGEIGVTLDINLMEWGAYLDHIARKDHDMFMLGWSSSYDPEVTSRSLFHTDSGGPTGNRAWYSNPELDDLIDEASQLLDWEDREPLYKEIQRIAMEDAVIIPLYVKETVVAMNKNLKGIRVSPVENHIYVYGYVEE